MDSKVIGPTLCPVCKGDGGHRAEGPDEQKEVYDQDAIWIELRKGTHERFEDILEKELKIIADFEEGKDEILVHLLFDRDVTPQGNIIFHHLIHSTITGGKVSELSSDEIESRNYCTDDEGKIRTWMEVPVSPAVWDFIQILENDKRICIFKVDANRKGSPLFCDENMLAFSLVLMKKDEARSLILDIEKLFREKHHTKITNISLCFLS